MNTSGRDAEERVADMLIQNGYEILESNWRNRYCEIDIVAKKGSCVHIVEVKYRQNDYFGYGYEYVGADKKRRLRRAAAAWASSYNWSGDMCIDVASVLGEEFAITYFDNAV